MISYQGCLELFGHVQWTQTAISKFIIRKIPSRTKQNQEKTSKSLLICQNFRLKRLLIQINFKLEVTLKKKTWKQIKYFKYFKIAFDLNSKNTLNSGIKTAKSWAFFLQWRVSIEIRNGFMIVLISFTFHFYLLCVFLRKFKQLLKNFILQYLLILENSGYSVIYTN